ncbi:MAG: hypothetical protein R3B81_01685 [bacterium]
MPHIRLITAIAVAGLLAGCADTSSSPTAVQREDTLQYETARMDLDFYAEATPDAAQTVILTDVALVEEIANYLGLDVGDEITVTDSATIAWIAERVEPANAPILARQAWAKVKAAFREGTKRHG